MKANYMVIGYGWRADFYYRIAKLLPEQFSICAGVLRTEARAKEVASKEHIFTTVDLDEALSQKPDFAVLCVPREIAKDYLVQLMEKGIPETTSNKAATTRRAFLICFFISSSSNCYDHSCSFSLLTDKSHLSLMDPHDFFTYSKP